MHWFYLSSRLEAVSSRCHTSWNKGTFSTFRPGTRTRNGVQIQTPAKFGVDMRKLRVPGDICSEIKREWRNLKREWRTALEYDHVQYSFALRVHRLFHKLTHREHVLWRFDFRQYSVACFSDLGEESCVCSNGVRQENRERSLPGGQVSGYEQVRLCSGDKISRTKACWMLAFHLPDTAYRSSIAFQCSAVTIVFPL